MKVIIVFTLSLLSFSGVYPTVREDHFPISREDNHPIVREDDYATGREDELALIDQNLNFLDKYDQGKYPSHVKSGFNTVPNNLLLNKLKM